MVIQKFIQLGLRSSIVPWITNFLSSRLQSVRYDGVLSSWETVDAGVAQGTKIGPTAFLVMINDFVTNLPEVSHFKYVDDMTLTQPFKNSDQTSSMQNELDHLQQWTTFNNMRLNPSKCQSMNFCFQRSPPVAPSFNIDGSFINQTDCLKILGVHVQSNLKWDTQIDQMCKSVNLKLQFSPINVSAVLHVLPLKTC